MPGALKVTSVGSTVWGSCSAPHDTKSQKKATRAVVSRSSRRAHFHRSTQQRKLLKNTVCASRDAAVQLDKLCIEAFKSIGFDTGSVLPCLCHHSKSDLAVWVHEDMLHIEFLEKDRARNSRGYLLCDGGKSERALTYEPDPRLVETALTATSLESTSDKS